MEAIICPCINSDPELVGYKMKERSKRQLVDAKDDTGKAEIAELDRKTKTVRRTAALPDDGKVGFTQVYRRIRSSRLSGKASKLSRSAAERIERRGMMFLLKRVVYENT